MPLESAGSHDRIMTAFFLKKQLKPVKNSDSFQNENNRHSGSNQKAELL